MSEAVGAWYQKGGVSVCDRWWQRVREEVVAACDRGGGNVVSEAGVSV